MASLTPVALMSGVSLASDAPKTEWLSGVANEDGSFGVVRVDAQLRVRSVLSSTERLHGIIRNPVRAEICAPARRPGNQFFVIRDGMDAAQIIAPTNRHLYGHGVYSKDGALLYLAENDFNGERGVIGIYDSANGYERLYELSSNGIGPHQILLHPDCVHLVVANGGILTHPHTGRAKLNIHEMQSSLHLIHAETGAVSDEGKLPDNLRQLSIRHIDVTRNGTVVFGVQDQVPRVGERPLVGVWYPGSDPIMFEAPSGGWQRGGGYVGSVAVDLSGRIAAAACPRRGVVLFWNLMNREFLGFHEEEDVCGVAPALASGQFLVTSGLGRMVILECSQAGVLVLRKVAYARRFDNHCLHVE